MDDLPTIQALLEANPRCHPFAGRIAENEPEDSGAYQNGREAGFTTLNAVYPNLDHVRRIYNVDAATQAKFFATLISFKYGTADTHTKLAEFARDSFRVAPANWDINDVGSQDVISKAASLVKKNFQWVAETFEWAPSL